MNKVESSPAGLDHEAEQSITRGIFCAVAWVLAPIGTDPAALDLLLTRLGVTPQHLSLEGVAQLRSELHAVIDGHTDEHERELAMHRLEELL